MGRHIQFATVSLEEFRNMARLHVKVLNHALANMPLIVRSSGAPHPSR
jgi:hypothetical protein